MICFINSAAAPAMRVIRASMNARAIGYSSMYSTAQRHEDHHHIEARVRCPRGNRLISDRLTVCVMRSVPSLRRSALDCVGTVSLAFRGPGSR